MKLENKYRIATILGGSITFLAISLWWGEMFKLYAVYKALIGIFLIFVIMLVFRFGSYVCYETGRRDYEGKPFGIEAMKIGVSYKVLSMVTISEHQEEETKMLLLLEPIDQRYFPVSVYIFCKIKKKLLPGNMKQGSAIFRKQEEKIVIDKAQ